MAQCVVCQGKLVPTQLVEDNPGVHTYVGFCEQCGRGEEWDEPHWSTQMLAKERPEPLQRNELTLRKSAEGVL